MGVFVEIRNYLPEPKTPRRLNSNSAGRKLASFGAALALTLSVTAPFPTARTDFGLQTDSPELPKSGWGGKCTIPGQQAVLRTAKGVSIAECEPNKKWYNDGTIYIVPSPAARR